MTGAVDAGAFTLRVLLAGGDLGSQSESALTAEQVCTAALEPLVWRSKQRLHPAGYAVAVYGDTEHHKYVFFGVTLMSLALCVSGPCCVMFADKPIRQLRNVAHMQVVYDAGAKRLTLRHLAHRLQCPDGLVLSW